MKVLNAKALDPVSKKFSLNDSLCGRGTSKLVLRTNILKKLSKESEIR